MHSFKELVQQFESRLNDTLPFPQELDTLYEPCRYFMNLGGKRVRPVLCLMSNELFGNITDDAWRAALGIELFHNFTLIHDDIMDKAPLRRGKITVHERNGLTAGILCGDVMSIYAYDQLAHIKTALPEILHLFNRTSIEVCEGQQLDMDFETRDDVSIDEYIHMITLKTSVLLACSLKMGALLGGATESTAGKLYEFGKNLGIAFQLQDDYLDAYSANTGKQIGGDIKSNKKTYLLLKALENANMLQQSAIRSLLQRDDDSKVDAMLSLFNNTGADVACRDAVKHYSDLAFGCLEEAAVPSSRKVHLHELATYLLGRDN
ncbi:MAG: polyprenyl synthetase [Bacteroidetes bacterium 43-93]|nr:polyprenyl synthetase family protein [Bacteroidota bacterium]OJX01618.1 MAG: polyprenyl synthetase [Bacteroidetes bacterium 43-93]